MNKKLSILSLLILFICFIHFPLTSSAVENNFNEIKTNSITQVEEKQTDRIIVKMKEETKDSGVSEYKIMKKNIGKEKKKVVLEVPPTENLDSFLKKIRETDGVESAEPDYLIKKSYVPKDPLYSLQWFHNNIRTPEAWDKTTGSSNITVAVLDSGFDLDHPDLTNQIDVAYDAVYNSYYTVPQDDHGTHVTGIIASSINNKMGGVGVAPNTRIIAINIFDESGYAYTSDLIEGIYFAMYSGANIINLSLGSYQYSYYANEAIQDAYNNGLLVVAAAGNERTYEPSYPASYNNVISVSSTDQNDTVSWFSNYGQYIDIAAPGSNIYSTVTGDTYNWMSGTSMASPVVAGIAALVWASDPTLTNDQVANRLISTADDLGPLGKDYFYGYGRINAKKALKLATLIVNSVNNKSTTVTGKTEKSASVSVSIGTKVYTSKADSYGIYKVVIPIQNDSTIITVGAKDPLGNSSVPKKIKISKVAPNKPIVNSVNNKSTIVTGKTEKSALVSVSTGTKVYTSKADSYGNYKVAIPITNAGTSISVKAKDSAGRISAASNIFVSRVAPNKPIVNSVNNKSTTVTGKTEKSTSVLVSIGSKVYTAKVDSYGNYKVAIPITNAGISIYVKAKDSVGRISAASNISVSRVAPNKPIVNSVNNKSTTVTGKTEKSTSVLVSIGSKVYTAKADSYGNYRVAIPITNAGTPISVKAKDSTGRISASSKISVIRIAPNIVTVSPVRYYSEIVSGKSEKYTKVTLKIKTKVYIGKADSIGNFKISIPKQSVGTKINAYATNSQGNVGAARIVLVY